MQRKMLVRFTRPFEEGNVNGYVLAVGPRFFVMAIIAEDIRLNGFQTTNTRRRNLLYI